ncbi:MAG: hypothetical protein SFX19_03780 [Alphaproteobacteria bacterium]|nr:hypothetical protein [Alphaproteobacteria bacterium]
MKITPEDIQQRFSATMENRGVDPNKCNNTAHHLDVIGRDLKGFDLDKTQGMAL